jgi:hypothetical protein
MRLFLLSRYAATRSLKAKTALSLTQEAVTAAAAAVTAAAAAAAAVTAAR